MELELRHGNENGFLPVLGFAETWQYLVLISGIRKLHKLYMWNLGVPGVDPTCALSHSD